MLIMSVLAVSDSLLAKRLWLVSAHCVWDIETPEAGKGGRNHLFQSVGILLRPLF